jgi:hypothetical protein
MNKRLEDWMDKYLGGIILVVLIGGICIAAVVTSSQESTTRELTPAENQRIDRMVDEQMAGYAAVDKRVSDKYR